MGPNVKPFTHWVIYKGYKVRFTTRTAQAVTGVLTAPDGAELLFRYDPDPMLVHLPTGRIEINQHGWEVAAAAAAPALTQENNP